MILDSMDKVRKNQRMQKENILFFLNRKMASANNDIKTKKPITVPGSKK